MQLIGCLVRLGLVLCMSVQPIDIMFKPLFFFHFSGLLIKSASDSIRAATNQPQPNQNNLPTTCKQLLTLCLFFTLPVSSPLTLERNHGNPGHQKQWSRMPPVCNRISCQYLPHCQVDNAGQSKFHFLPIQEDICIVSGIDFETQNYNYINKAKVQVGCPQSAIKLAANISIT